MRDVAFLTQVNGAPYNPAGRIVLMSLPPLLPPPRCDVLVVGAGPAGSACAHWLARHGMDALLVDQQDFPRDKTCGDGLIPDAHAALQRLGVLDEVLAVAQSLTHVRCYAPSGRFVDIPGALAVLPRRQLDHLLVQAAQRAGARLATPWRFDSPLRDDDRRVVGARLRRMGSEPRQVAEIRARHVVLATGAAPQALMVSELCTRQVPSAMGLRGYVRHAGMAERIPHLEVAWHPRLSGGYGWIFPCGQDIYNVGIGITDSHQARSHAMRDLNLREVFAQFVRVHPNARDLMATGQLQGELKGAPLRSSLEGATHAAPGVLVTGEAAGSTYSFTGEGIGKAMETGIMAAEALLAGRAEALDDAGVAAHYTQALAGLKPKFAMYDKGNRVNHLPWLTEILIRRAARSERLRARMGRLLEERATPAQLITLRGLFKLFTE